MYNYFQQQPDFLGAMKNYTGGGVNTWTAPTTPVASALPQLQQKQQTDPMQTYMQNYLNSQSGRDNSFLIDYWRQKYGLQWPVQG